jgi:dCTP deaminase
MTLLNHEGLTEAMHAPVKGRLVVAPLLENRQVGPASIDLRLGTDFLFLKRRDMAGLDPSQLRADVGAEMVHELVSVPIGSSLWLHPQQFVLGSTLEFVRMPSGLAGFLLGRSSWARLGLIVETAGLVQPGFAGTLTYELVNTGDSPIRLYPGLRVAQLAVHRLEKPTSHSYRGDEEHPPKYVAAIGPGESRLAWEETEISKVLELGEALRLPATTHASNSNGS